jgi:acetoin utilization deacetylase AcuC-like enzyme
LRVECRSQGLLFAVITFFSPLQALHAPEHEFFRGERVPCHENPQRAAFVLDALRQRGHALREPDHDAAVVLPRVHTPRYLAFLASAWAQWLALDAANAQRQPFPSVWACIRWTTARRCRPAPGPLPRPAPTPPSAPHHC